MQLTIDIPDPKFKVGDFITYYLGPNKDYRGIFWIGKMEIQGEFAFWYFDGPDKKPKSWVTDMKDNELGCRYAISCQEDIVDRDTGRVWYKKGQMSCPSIHEVDTSKSEKIDWLHEPIPLPR